MNDLNKGCILFDWGDTLMRVFPEFHGPMKDWPKVEALPDAAEALAALHPDWTLALATNAPDSDEEEIRLALRRAGLDAFLDRIYGFKMIGHRKPSPEFYRYILDDLEIPADQAVMVGDDFEADVLGANRSGLRAIWFNPHTPEDRRNEKQRTVHELGALPELLWEFMRSS